MSENFFPTKFEVKVDADCPTCRSNAVEKNPAAP